jgi:type I restriction enzyme R subunit
MSEAKARIKINALLSEAGWKFFDDEQGHANIILENHVHITEHLLNEWGEDFEKTHSGFIDFLLLDKDGFPFVVLEAKAEEKNWASPHRMDTKLRSTYNQLGEKK